EIEKNTPKNISLTDPAAQWSAAWGPAFYAYSANYLIDIAAGIVVDVEATPAHKIDEINATKTMIERVEDRFELKPDRLIGDTNYGTAEILGWMVDEKQIERSEEHTSELQSRFDLVCRLLLEKKKKKK